MMALHQVVDTPHPHHPLQHHLLHRNRRKEKSHIQAVMWRRNKVKHVNVKENDHQTIEHKKHPKSKKCKQRHTSDTSYVNSSESESEVEVVKKRNVD